MERVVGWEFKRARNLFTAILRHEPYDPAACLAWIAGVIAIFLLQLEPLLWRRGIFRVLEDYVGRWPSELEPLAGFWSWPFERLPPSLQSGLWLPAVVIYLVNSVLLDRFVGKHGGGDVSYSPWALGLRRTLVGLPVLGMCVLPLWRILAARRPAWAVRRSNPDLQLGDITRDRPELERLLPTSGPELHSTPFLVWILISNLLALRTVAVWLNDPVRATEACLLGLQVLCGALRLAGLASFLAYAVLRIRSGAVWGKRRWGLLASSAGWLLPQSLFLLPMLAALKLGEQRGTVTEEARTRTMAERDAVQVLGGRFIRVVLSLASADPDRATSRVLKLYREKIFLLLTEIASVMMLVLPSRERFPLLNVPGCLTTLVYLVSLLSFPLGLALYGRSLWRTFSGSLDSEKTAADRLFARCLLLTSLAVVGGFNIGVLAGLRKLSLLAALLFWIGAFGSVFSLAAFLASGLNWREMSRFLWLILFLDISFTGHQMQQTTFEIDLLGYNRQIANPAQFHLFKLYLMIPVVLFLTVFFGLLRGSWLLRPFRVKDLFNRALPGWLRGQLAFLLLTAPLPLGGLLVPLWIRLRSRLVENQAILAGT